MLRDDDGWWYRASKDAEITIERTRNPYASAYEVLRTDDDQQWSYVGSLTDILGNGRYPWMYLEARNCSATTTPMSRPSTAARCASV